MSDGKGEKRGKRERDRPGELQLRCRPEPPRQAAAPPQASWRGAAEGDGQRRVRGEKKDKGERADR